MSQEAAFLNAIRAHPADDTVRLVYAGWLEERNSPGDLERATYLRELANRTPDLNDLRGKRFAIQVDGEYGADIPDVGSDWLSLVDKVAVENCPVVQERMEQVSLD